MGFPPFGSGGAGGGSPGPGSAGGGTPPTNNPYNPPSSSPNPTTGPTGSPSTTYGGNPPVWHPSAQLDSSGNNMLWDATGQYKGAISREQAARYGGRLAASTVGGHEYPEMDIYEFVYGTSKPASTARGEPLQAALAAAQQSGGNTAVTSAPPRTSTSVTGQIMPQTPDYRTQANALSQIATQRAATTTNPYEQQYYTNLAKQWLDYAGRVPVGAAQPALGTAPQIFQTAGTWLQMMQNTPGVMFDPGLYGWANMASGGMPQIPQIQVRPIYDPSMEPTIETGPVRAPMLHGSIFPNWNESGAPTTQTYNWPGSTPNVTQDVYGKILGSGGGSTAPMIQMPSMTQGFDPGYTSGIPNQSWPSGVMDPSGWVSDPRISGFTTPDTGGMFGLPSNPQPSIIFGDGSMRSGTLVPLQGGGYTTVWGPIRYASPYADPSSPYYLAPVR